MLEGCFFPVPVPLKRYMLTAEQYIFQRKPCHMLLGKFVFCGCGVELVTLFVSSKLSNESFFMTTLFLTRLYHYLTASTEGKYSLVNHVFFHIPPLHSSFISCQTNLLVYCTKLFTSVV